MDRGQMLRALDAEQFAAFDMQLYLDTHPEDKVALQMINNYHYNYEEYKKQFEMIYGPLRADSAAKNDQWMWIDGPWPWEMEAN